MSQAALDTISTMANDPRADGARRAVHVSTTQVTIERLFQGMRMRIGVPTNAYRGLVIAVRLPSGRATLHLRHADSDLDVVLAEDDAIAIARLARTWAESTGHPISIEKAFVAMHDAIGRRTKRAAPTRRSRFARRRKTGIVDRLARSFAHEDEIIARD